MKIINVAPIAKGFTGETLSYFTSKNVEIGGIVSIAIKKRVVPGVVIAVMDAKQAKIDLRNSSFALKSIKAVKSSGLITPNFLLACKETAQYFVSPIGSVLADFIPKVILDTASNDLAPALLSEFKTPSFHLDVSVCQGTREERMQNYRSIIREEFAKGHSVFFCVPTASEMEEFSEGLKRGIEKYTVSVHSRLSKKKLLETWKFIINENHPILIVGTKTFLSVPRRDLGAIIVDPESSPFFKMEARPCIDVRKAIEIISAKLGTRLIFGDSLVRAESFVKSGKAQLPRVLTDAQQIVVDMKRKENSETGKKEEFKVLSEKLIEMLTSSVNNNENSLLFINRRGHASTTVCNDCLRSVLCGKCEAPLVIHKESGAGKKAKFVCHKCLTETEVPEQCPYCQSWKLVSLGVGVQRVAEDLESIFPGVKIFRLDSDLVKTKKKGDDIAEKFFSSPGAILVATESLFSYVRKPVDNVAVVSLDAIFTLPEFRTNEKAFQILLKLRALARKNFLIQTRTPELKLFDDAIRGNITGFYQEELEERKSFNYPPFKILIKITKGNSDKILLKKEVDSLVLQLKNFDVIDYPAFIPKEKNLYKWNIVIKIDPGTWPMGQAKLHSFLFYLPPAWRVDVEPDSLL